MLQIVLLRELGLGLAGSLWKIIPSLKVTAKAHIVERWISFWEGLFSGGRFASFRERSLVFKKGNICIIRGEDPTLNE